MTSLGTPPDGPPPGTAAPVPGQAGHRQTPLSGDVRDLASETGVRQQISVLLPVALLVEPRDLAAVDGWATGPLPFPLGRRVTDTATRSTYFMPSAARALYGTPERPCRWHSTARVTRGPLRLDGTELLHTATERRPDRALAVLHLTVCGPHLLDTLRAIGHRIPAADDPLTGPLDPGVLLADVAEVRTAEGPFAPAHPYTVAFFTPSSSPGQRPALRPGPGAAVPASADRWLWQLAARVNGHDFPPAPETAQEFADEAVRISADWSAQVLRSGAAFLGHRPDCGEGDFYGFAAVHSRTVYLDALLLGTLQRGHIEEIADELSEVFDRPRLTRRVGSLERRIAHFRSTYWRQHLTAHGPANSLLTAFQDQHRLPARFTEILAEAGDYASLAQTQESQQINGALGLLTILGLPIGTALGVLQVLGHESAGSLVIALVASAAATAAALLTPYGRLVLQALRGL